MTLNLQIDCETMVDEIKKPFLLGDYQLQKQHFPTAEEELEQLSTLEFKSQPSRKKFKKVNQVLLRLILESPEESFLLTPVLDFIHAVNHHQILDTFYNFSLFEFWLNHFSGLDEETNQLVRGKIVGKYVPRDEYQVFFPVGMGKQFSGTHFVTAHLSPDVDTTIASFWGWMDAFGARVSEGQHHWCVPGGNNDGHVKMIFHTLFTDAVFPNLSRVTGTLTLSAIDLLTQEGMVKKKGDALVTQMDHKQGSQAVIYVDEKGHFLGDWRSGDVEPVRQISMMFNSCMRWYENFLHTKLITLFAQEHLHKEEIPEYLDTLFNITIKDCEPVQEFQSRQRTHFHHFLKKIIGLEKGTGSSFGELIHQLGSLYLCDFSEFRSMLEGLKDSDLFDQDGNLKENRPLIFNRLEKIIHALDLAIQSARNYVDQLHISMRIKHEVLEFERHYVSMNSDVEELRAKMKHYHYLTVVIPEKDGKLFAVGIVTAASLRKPILGTVTLRDFSNHAETRMASYLDVISVIDHHKASLNTGSAPMAIIGDAQSANVLVAEQTFLINDKFSTGGISNEEINHQIQRHLGAKPTAASSRILKKLFMKRLAYQEKREFFVHPNREFSAYLSFLYAILDDTDLLTKVTNRDVECVASLLNRMKTLVTGKETEIIHFDDIPRDRYFANKAAKKILQHPDMYSIYKRIYAFREADVEGSIVACVEEKPSNFFSDTKEQNGCCRVGQSKMFASNIPLFQANEAVIRAKWSDLAMRAHKHKPEIDLHIHMVTTISSADEVYQGNIEKYSHHDGFWFWIAPTQSGYDHLASFLNAFQTCREVIENHLSLELYGEHVKDLEELFERNFLKCPITRSNHEVSQPLAVLRFNAGSLNSRKSMVTPYLPRIVT